MSDDIEAYSESTGKRYPNWDALVKAEAHGYVVVLVSDRPNTVPGVTGLWTSKVEATKARVRLRNQAAKREAPYRVRSYLRILWKDAPQR